MRNKKVAAGNHLLLLSCSGAWSYGFRHYPRGPYPSRHNASCLGGEWMSCGSSYDLPATQMCSKLFHCSCFPMDSGLAKQSVAHSDFGRCRSSSPSTTLIRNWRLRGKNRGLQKLGQHDTSFFRPDNGGSRFMLPHFHKSTNQ